MTLADNEGRLTLSFSGLAFGDGHVPINLLAWKLQALQSLLFHAAAAVARDRSARRGPWTNRYRGIAELNFIATRPGSLMVDVALPQQEPVLHPDFDGSKKVVDLVFRLGETLTGPSAQAKSIDLPQDDEAYLLRAFDALVPGPLEDYQLELSNGRIDGYRPLVMTSATREVIRRRLMREAIPAVAEVATLVGELIKIHVDVSPEKISIRTKSREIDCFYPNALRDQIANLLAGSMVEVTGNAIMNGQGHIERLDLLESVFTVSMEPLRIARFEDAGQVFSLKKPLLVEVEFSDGLWVYHNPLINLWGYGERREEALKDLHENFAYLWRELAEEPDEHLESRALAVKRRLIDITDRSPTGA